MPEQGTEKWPACPDRLTGEQLADFRERGFLAFNGVFSEDEVATACERLSALVRGLVAESGTPGREQNALTKAGGRFAVQFERDKDISGLDGHALELKVRKLMWYCEVDDYFRDMSLHHPGIQRILESLLGPGSVLFQDMALIKPPKIGSIKPWHQDNAYFSVLPLDAVVGVWIALDRATVANGCMHVIPGGHREGPLKHYHNRDCEIVPDRIDTSRTVPIELEPGGALFFYGMLPHQTPPNRSTVRRRALQWHYHSATAQTVTQEAFDKEFAEADGTPASCRAAGEQETRA